MKVLKNYSLYLKTRKELNPDGKFGFLRDL